MYGDDVYDEAGRLDNDRRFANADAFFAEIEADKSLIFYDANYCGHFCFSRPGCWSVLPPSSILPECRGAIAERCPATRGRQPGGGTAAAVVPCAREAGKRASVSPLHAVSRR